MGEQINTATILILTETEVEEPDKTIDDYKKLNDRCDTVISKIKNRKEKDKK